jgi:hypothetical protein
MATKYAVGELHPNTSPQRISELLNRASGDGWELVAVVEPNKLPRHVAVLPTP